MLKVTVLSALIMWALVALMGWFIEGEPALLAEPLERRAGHRLGLAGDHAAGLWR